MTSHVILVTQCNLTKLELDKVPNNEALRVTVGTTKDIPVETRRSMVSHRSRKRDRQWNRSKVSSIILLIITKIYGAPHLPP